MARVRLRGSTDYPVKSPGPICEAEAKGLLLRFADKPKKGKAQGKGSERKLYSGVYAGTADYFFARKFDLAKCPKAYEVADEARRVQAHQLKAQAKAKSKAKAKALRIDTHRLARFARFARFA